MSSHTLTGAGRAATPSSQFCDIGRDLLLAAWLPASAAFLLLVFAGFLQ